MLDRLTYADGIWSGHVVGVEICVAGDSSGANKKQAEALVECLANLAGLKEQIHAFLNEHVATLPGVKASDFHLRSLDFLWPSEPDYFMAYLTLEGDDHGLWKLEFVDGEPKFLSRDD